MKRVFKIVSLLFLGLELLFLSTYVLSYRQILLRPNPKIFIDLPRYQAINIHEILHPVLPNEFQAILQEAREKKIKISTAGSRKSLGGHFIAENGILVDMTNFNSVFTIDKDLQQVWVQSGAKWIAVQHALSAQGLAVKVMPSWNQLTVGGSLSSNAHGIDLEQNAIAESVLDFRLMTPDGQVRNVSRTDNPELFKLALGGYGLFGWILDIHLQVTPDEWVEKKNYLVKTADFPQVFLEQILNDKEYSHAYGRLGLDPKAYMSEMIITAWHKVPTRSALPLPAFIIKPDILPEQFLFSLSRDFDLAKTLRWTLQKANYPPARPEETFISRNQSMMAPLAPQENLTHEHWQKTDILQEYFIPKQYFVDFVTGLRSTVLNSKLNITQALVKFTKANQDSFLPTNPKDDSFSITLLISTKWDTRSQKEIQDVSRRLIDLVELFGGGYSLNYQNLASPQQFLNAYPQAKTFFRLKDKLDPEHLFSNVFYETYAEPILRL